MVERFDDQNFSSEFSGLNLYSASGEENETDSTRSSTMAQLSGPESTECVNATSFMPNSSLSQSSGTESTLRATAATIEPGSSQSQSSESGSTERANAAISVPNSSQLSLDRPEPSTREKLPGKVRKKLPKQSSGPRRAIPEEIIRKHWLEGFCKYEDRCRHIHGEKCEICKKNCLVPGDLGQQRNHREICEQKMCCVCHENVETKCPIENSVFGLLENCNHKFCLICIKEWKTSKLGERKIPTCPYCRVPYNLVIPSSVWPDTPDAKQKIIDSHKDLLSKIECKYHKEEKCYYRTFCFYFHPNKHVRETNPRRPHSPVSRLSFISQQFIQQTRDVFPGYQQLNNFMRR